MTGYLKRLFRISVSDLSVGGYSKVLSYYQIHSNACPAEADGHSPMHALEEAGG